jgi:hypothetical protein
MVALVRFMSERAASAPAVSADDALANDPR